MNIQFLPQLCPADAAPGEIEVFTLLEADKGTAGWIGLHSLDLAKHVRQVRGEADFVLLIPDQAIVILEIKSHTEVRFDHRGWWLGAKATKPEAKGPFWQGEQAMHSVREYLTQRGEAKSIPMLSVVIFTGVRFAVESPEWHSWQLLDKQSLHARSISANILRIIEQAREHFVSKGLGWVAANIDASPRKLHSIAAILRPRFEMLASPAVRRRALDDNLLTCTQQQFRFLDSWSENERLLTAGLAGTGKTTLAIEAVRREKAANPTSVIGFFCFNKLLGKRLAQECEGLGDSVKVGHFHQWMASLVGITSHQQESLTSDFWRDKLPEKVLGMLTSPGMSEGILDYLVLDESQDLFLEAYLDIFDLLLKGGLKAGRWLFVGDFERQDIFVGGAISKMDFYKKRVEQRCGVFKLDENCRNTPEISYTMSRFAGLTPGYTRVLRQDSRQDPEVLFYKTEEEQANLAFQAWDRSLAAGFKPRDIVFLSPYRENAIGPRLVASPSFKGRLGEYALNGQLAGFTTIHAFKGLEAAVVILTDIHDLDDARRIDLFYVGMSRALHRLVILCHDSSHSALKKLVL